MTDKEVISGVYMIRNTESDKVYVGQSKDIYTRKQNHFTMLRNGKHHCHHLQRSWNKHGNNCWEFEVLEVVDEENEEGLLERELYWIEQLKADYNSTPGSYGKLPSDKFYALYVPTIKTKDRDKRRPEWHKYAYGGKRNPGISRRRPA